MAEQKNLQTMAFLVPDSEGQISSADLKKFGKEVDNKAQETIDWYFKQKKSQSFASKALRVIAILLVLVGGLSPILQCLGLVDSLYGYIALAIAAACIAFDKFMGFSTAWMRYMTTAFNLQTALAEFRSDWLLMWAEVKNDSPTEEQQKRLLSRIKEFYTKINTAIERETQLWVNEFQSNLAQLQRTTQATLESTQPGILELTVANAQRAKSGLNVMVDGLTVARMTGEHLQIGHIVSGQHKVTVHGNVDGKEVQASSIVNMTANAMVELKMLLPVE